MDLRPRRGESTRIKARTLPGENQGQTDKQIASGDDTGGVVVHIIRAIVCLDTWNLNNRGCRCIKKNRPREPSHVQGNAVVAERCSDPKKAHWPDHALAKARLEKLFQAALMRKAATETVPTIPTHTHTKKKTRSKENHNSSIG